MSFHRRSRTHPRWCRVISYIMALVVVGVLMVHSLRLSTTLHLYQAAGEEAIQPLRRSVTSTTETFSSGTSKPTITSESSSMGILSQKPENFFRKLQDEIDREDPVVRCGRYGRTVQQNTTRRIFWGSLIASESRELMEIVAAETYGIFEAIVLVEGNRTQNFTPRKFQHLESRNDVQTLFGVENVAIRAFVNEDDKLLDLKREHAQRALIISGWKDFGMTDDDIGILSDLDETFTRDFLRAIQTCDFPHFEPHDCHYRNVKLTARTRVFESSPECITASRAWFHPDLILGHCIEGIGHHLPAPREVDSFERAEGYGKDCMKFNESLHVETGYHAWNAADFRRTCGGNMVSLTNKRNKFRNTFTLSEYTGFHFHNFFAQFQSTRFKYLTYGHPDKKVMTKPMHNISNDLHMMVHCAKGEPDGDDQKWKRVVGGFNASEPFWPIYFQDPDYRKRRHEHVRKMVLDDEAFMEKNQPKVTVVESPKLPNPSPIEELKQITSTGISLKDRALYEPTDIGGDSSTSTVMALATGYDLRVYKRFVGSLRKTGYKGHIYLGVSPDVSNEIVEYLKSRDVTMRQLQWVNCTYKEIAGLNERRSHCAHPYPDIKVRWSRFPLAREWLRDCKTCTGPILLMDARDSIFQRDPFVDLPSIVGLHVFQEDPGMTTENWLVQWPIRKCKQKNFTGRPMLCSGTTAGTRAAMLKYLEIMYEEMRIWIKDPECRFDIDGDDQSIHNYLYYSGQLPFAKSIPNRQGGIVNTIGHTASQVANAHFDHWRAKKKLEKWDAKLIPYEGATDRNWLGAHLNLTNENGMLIERDGSISRVVHQYDRFHYMYESWLDRQTWASD